MASTNSVALSVEICLRIIGIWPDVPYTLLYRCVWVLSIGMIQTCQYWYIIIHFGSEDLSELMDCLSVTLEYTVMFLRLTILWLNTRILYDLIATMARDWRDVTTAHMHTMSSKANLSHRFSNVVVGLHSAAVLFYGIGVLVSYINDYDVTEEASVREFAVKMQLPFDCNESPMHEIIMFVQFLHQLTSSAVTGALNSLIVTLILHTSGQIDILCDSLMEISLERNNRRSVVSITKELIDKHQKIIVFANKIESIFCYIALIQFIASTSVFCCLGYMIVTSISSMQASNSFDSSGLMKGIVFYMAILVEAFIFCFSGEYLSAKSKMIGDAAYKSSWYDLKPSDSKLILLLILRSQRRLTITVGKIMDLSLEGFTTILKASVSYVSVLHAMY